MKVVTLTKFGGPDSLIVRDIAAPATMSHSHLYIRHSAIGINMIDIHMRSTEFNLAEYNVKDGIIGVEAVGVIERVGSSVAGKFFEKQRVGYGLGAIGSYAEKRVIDSGFVFNIPDEISDEIASVCLRKGLMAYTLLFKVYKVTKGSTIIIHSVTSDIAHILASWATSKGVKVIGTVDSDDKIAFAKSLGCVLVLNYNSNIVEAVMNFTKGVGVNAVYDDIGVAVCESSLKCLAIFGIYISYGESSGRIVNILNADFIYKSLFFTRPTLEHYQRHRQGIILAINEVFQEVLNGNIKLNINRYRMNDIAKAHADLERKTINGAAVVVCGN